MSTPRAKATATTLLDGTVILIGGSNGTTDLASAEFFDSAANNFNAAGSLATARSKHSAFLLPNNNEVLVVGGQSAGTDLASAELYIPWQKAFQATGAMATPRSDATGAALTKVDGRLLIAGGSSASAELYGFATVKTDAADYPPGTTVNITGSGWQPGETVTLTLVESPLIDTHGPFPAVADGNGNISDSSFITDLHDVNVAFSLTAVGSASKWQAQNSFTDAPQKPTSTITFPADGAFYRTSVWTGTIAGTATFATGTTSRAVNVSIKRNSTGKYWNGTLFNNSTETGTSLRLATLSGSTWTLSFPASNFPADDSYTVHSVASDSNGTENGTTTSIFTLDNVAPTAPTALSLASGSDTGSSQSDEITNLATNLNFAGMAEAKSTVNLFVDGSATSAGSGTTGNGGNWNNITAAGTLSEGTHTIRATATDQAGNVSVLSSPLTITIDTTAPTMGLSPASGTVNTPFSFSWSITDPTSAGVSSGVNTSTCKVTIDAVQVSTACSGSHSITTAGSHTVVVSATDIAGNAGSDTRSYVVVTDNQAPVVTVSFPAPVHGSGDWYNGQDTVPVVGTVSADDTTTGNSNITAISCSGATVGTISRLNTHAASASLTVSGDGSHNVSCTATDSANNTGAFTGSTAMPVVVKIDTVAPTGVTGAASRVPDHNGWYTSAVVITFSGTDTTSGIANCTSTPYSGPDSATASVLGHCTDNAGNTSADLTFSLKFDSTPPTAVALSVTAGTAGANGWYTSEVTLHTSGTETVSTPLSCTADQFQTAETAGQLFNGSCTNDAGLTANAAPLTVKLDKTGPTASLAVTAGTLGDNGWYVSDVTVHAAGTDNISNPTTCTADQFLTTDSPGHTFSGSCTNDAGLTTNATDLTVKRDATPPTVHITPDRAADHNGWYNHTLTFANPGTDATSGIANCTTPAAYSGPDSMTASVTATCKDNAGNTGNGSLNFQFDSTPPTNVTGAPNRSADHNGWFNHAVDVVFTGNDATSGIDTCTTVNYAGPDTATASALGHCTDNAGNTSSPDSASSTFKFDSTPPTAALAVTAGTLGTHSWYTSIVTVSTSGTDTVSNPTVCTSAQYQTAETTGTLFNGSCTNDAGLTTNAAPLTVKLDKTAPTNVILTPSGTLGLNNWYTSDVTIQTSGTETISNPISCTVDQFQTTDTASRTLDGSCTNDAGLTSVDSHVTIKRDATPPVLTLTFTPNSPDGNNGWWKTPAGVPFNWTCTDATSGVDTTYNGGCPTPLSGTVTANGTTHFADQVRDEAGNLSVAVSRDLMLDNVAPVITWNAVGDSCSLPGNPPWCRGTQTAAFTANDATSGLAYPAQASFTQSTGTNGTAITIASGAVMDAAGNVNPGINAGPYKIDSVAPTITINSPGNLGNYVLNAAVAANYSCNDTTSGVLNCTGSVANGANFSTNPVNLHTFTVNATDAAGNPATQSVSYSVLYSTGACLGSAGHTILQPINYTGDSVFPKKQGSTVPAKFRVCDVNGNSIGSAGVVNDFRITQIVAGTVLNPTNELVDSTTPDSAFRFDPSGGQWIYNISTKNYNAGGTYFFRVFLNDGTNIDFDFGLK